MKKKEKKESDLKWVIEAAISTFILAAVISYISQNGISNLNIFWSIIILIVIMLIGIIFDMIGVAVTVANENHFNAKATKKAEGSKTSLKLIKNAPRVANVCADIVGDICGIVSGAISAMIALKIVDMYGVSKNVEFLISALVSAITVGGKALGKGFADRNSTKIVYRVGILLDKFLKD